MPRYSYIDAFPDTTFSGTVASGDLASGSVQGFFGTVRNISSGTVGSFDFGSGAVVAGSVGSGAIVSGNVASGQLALFHHASGAFTSGWAFGSGSLYGSLGPQALIASGTINSQDLGSGIVTNLYLGSGAVQSGAYASGSISTYKIASGTTDPSAQEVKLFVSGGIWTVLSSETISGGRCVSVDPSIAGPAVRVAMAALSGRMPAVGYLPSSENVLSGIQCNIRMGGMVAQTSGMGDFSGMIGRRVWVANSGQLCVLSGSWWSGGALSGSVAQNMGVIVTNLSGMVASTIALNISPFVYSGGPLGIANGILLP